MGLVHGAEARAQRHRSTGVFLALCLLFITPAFAGEVSIPQVRDSDLKIELFASEPAIVTPIGLAIDRQNRLFVIESHTHQPRADYSGPKFDRVKIFSDTDGDGKAESVSTFAENLKWSMNLAFSPAHELYFTHRNGVAVLHDRDHDGMSEARSEIVKLETDANYPHNGIDSLAFSPDGWVYFGLGENQGWAYTVRGTDRSSHSGQGEGGNIFRCRTDGSQLQFVATGFWNPFALEFDSRGSLFCVDNDPDGRPPCRLLHIIDGGNYGYKFRHGRSGHHPFVAWEGELPGTLPMIAGTGEAPSGVLDCAKARLPARYRGHLLVTSWGDDTIESYALKPNGVSFRAEKEILVEGDKSFRPVAIVAGPDGAVYITDWADQTYPVHGKGRIWKLAAKPPSPGSDRQDAASVRALDSPAEKRLKRLLAASSHQEYDELSAALADIDPFIRSAAITALARPIFAARILQDQSNERPEVRAGALLALRQARFAAPEPILRNSLADPDENVRLVALLWIGEEKLTALAGDIPKALANGSVTPALFKAYLAASDALAGREAPASKSLPALGVQGATGAAFIEKILKDAAAPLHLRALALAMVPNPDDPRIFSVVSQLALAPDSPLSTEAVRTLALASTNQAAVLLRQIAENPDRAPQLRAEAISALSGRPLGDWFGLSRLLEDPNKDVRIEVARTLRLHAAESRVREALLKKRQSLSGSPDDAELAAQLNLTLGAINSSEHRSVPARPDSDAGWRAALRGDGNRESGRRVFFSPAVSCAKCHRVQGRGGQIGPDLSVIARSSDGEKLTESILHPSQDIAPQFVQYRVETKDGESLSGLLASRAPDGTVGIATADAGIRTIAGDRVAALHPSSVSLMPEDLEKSMSVQDFRDLLAFLLSLK